VLCHAGFVDRRMWDGQWKAFTQQYRVLRFEMLGFGKSDSAAVPVSRREGLYCLLKELRIENVHLLGCSMGWEMAIDFTLELRETVLSLVIVSGTPGGFKMQGEPSVQLIEMLKALERNGLKTVSELQIQLWVDGGFCQPEHVNSHVRKLATEMNQSCAGVPRSKLARYSTEVKPKTNLFIISHCSGGSLEYQETSY
jgi:pimeloyl-ACP methyl ester carboxylesterase